MYSSKLFLESRLMNTTQIGSSQSPKAVALALFNEFLNGGKSEVVNRLVSPDYTGSTGQGAEGFIGLTAPLRQGFPDLHFKILDVIEEGSKAVVRWTSLGTHNGVFAGVAPTGRQVYNEGIAIYRVENGRVVEAWSQVDRLGVLQQIGALPSRGSGPSAQTQETRSA
jgi:predicted ester cyclase